MYRTVKAGLEWKLPKSRVKDLMMYCVSRLNLRRTLALDGTVCPKVLFTGLKPNYRKELSLAFGDYVEVYTGTDNTSRERSVPCIALYPVGNATGTWQFWNLHTKRYVRHSTWVWMRSSALIADIINNIADEEYARTDGENEADLVSTPTHEEEKIEDKEEINEGDNLEEVGVREEPVDSAEGATQDPETGGQPVRWSARIATGVQPPECFVHASFVNRSR
jgi:hypothetical protein